MDHMKTVVVHPGYKKEDHAVETWTLSINNSVTLHVNVHTLIMIILYLVHAKNYLQIIINHNKPLALSQLIAMELQATVYLLLMDHMKMVVVLLLSKKVDLAVETLTLSIKDNAILHVNVDMLMVIILCLEHVKNYPQIRINHNKPLALPQMSVIVTQTTVYSLLMDHMKTVVVHLGYKKEDLVVET
jgi:hypothetical protein